MKQVYIFSGLGADERVFGRLAFTGCNVNFIKWVIPGRIESMASYAEKLTEQILSADAIYIGLSFGGMMAMEVSKFIKPGQLILIASAKGRQEIPRYYRWAGMLRLHKLLPASILKKSSFITNWFFGVTKLEDKQLLAAILSDTDNRFLKWAIDKIVSWQHTELPANCTHIHGTADRILPYRFVKADITVHGGGHFMSVNKCQELKGILEELLNE